MLLDGWSTDAMQRSVEESQRSLFARLSGECKKPGKKKILLSRAHIAIRCVRVPTTNNPRVVLCCPS